MNNLKEEFYRIASDGYLGDPYGTDSYAYLRASSERQVEEGSSFPRQLESINKAAKRDSLRIPFDLIFFDDGYTGFEFEHRPALLKLRHEIKSRPRAIHLVIEDIDRLSRNADWQQGFLLEELSRASIQVHFYINPGSQLERYVRGYIAQEGMKKDIERMRMGSIYKAMDGKVTAKRPRYGYIKTDPRDSYYELHPEESKIMRAVYEKIIYDGLTLHKIAKWMNDTQIPTRFKTGFWTASTLYQLVKSTVYKGVFYANRVYQVKTGEYNKDGRPKRTNRIRPRDEWIEVSVPAIVTPEEWQQAQEIMSRNAKRSTRNGKKGKWLLQGISKCKHCPEYSFLALQQSKDTWKNYYGCSSRRSEKARMLKTACYSPYVTKEDLERRVWEEIETVIYDPEIIIRRLDKKNQEELTMSYQAQLEFVNSQLSELAKEKTKYEMAYQRDIYTLDEFEEKMKNIRGKEKSLKLSREKLEEKLIETHSIEEQKHIVIKALNKIKAEVEKARQNKTQPQEIPFELKRRILSILVDVIWVDSVERTFTIEGEIRGTFALDDDNSESRSNSGGSPFSLPTSNQKGNFGFTSTPRWR